MTTPTIQTTTPTSATVSFDRDATQIAERQYLQSGDGDINGMFRRVANWAASLETPDDQRNQIAQAFFELMASKRFCPGGRILAGAGSAHGNVLNCFVQGATDHHPGSFHGVMEVTRKLGLITKVGGGNGVNLDALQRHSGEPQPTRGHVYLSSAHADLELFLRGAMRPSNQMSGDHIEYPLRRWQRHVYGPLTPAQRALAEHHGVICIESEPDFDKVIRVSDSLEAILDANASLCAQGLGGTPPMLDLSHLRPEGTPIRGSGGTASGPVSFLIELFEHALEWVALGGIHSGPVGTLRHLYAPVLRVVKQGGSRRGAGMATLDINHPDVLDFLTAKDLGREQNEGDISSFNVSLLVSDAFMETLESDGLWAVVPSEVPGKYRVKHISEPYTGWRSGDHPVQATQDSDAVTTVPVYEGAIPAAWLWREIAQRAWNSGEPGVIFIDTINAHSALKNLGQRYTIRATNPCGEIGLTVGEPCDVGAINLAAYVHDHNIAGVSAPMFDFERFETDIATCVRFLDNALDLNVFVLSDNRIASHDLRRLGLGVMGLADALIRLGLRYDSREARDQVTRIMATLRDSALLESERLATERGVYPVYAKHEIAIPHKPRRNVALLTVAPTGTTSMLMGVSSGIEPVFSPFIYRNIGGEYKALVAPLFKELLEQFPPAPDFANGTEWNWDAVTKAIATNHGSVAGLEFVPETIRTVFVCAHDIASLDHVAMQASIQRVFDTRGHAGNSLSKTINLANSATVSEVETAFSAAYKGGCKGITVYRDGSRGAQVLTTSLEATTSAALDEKSDAALETVHDFAPETALDFAAHSQSLSPQTPERRKPFFVRPERLEGVTDMVKLTELAHGVQRTFLVTVNSSASGAVELVLVAGRAGDEANADSEALGRLTSIALQHGVPVEAIIKTLRGINGGLYGSYNHALVASKADLIAVALERSLQRPAPPAHAMNGYIPPLVGGAPDAPITKQAAPLTIEGATRCPKCHNISVVYADGCRTCRACHDSRCG